MCSEQRKPAQQKPAQTSFILFARFLASRRTRPRLVAQEGDRSCSQIRPETGFSRLGVQLVGFDEGAKPLIPDLQ